MLCLSDVDGASYKAVRQWYHRAHELLHELSKWHRPVIAIDETKVKVKQRWYFFWTTVDTVSRELLEVALKSTRDGCDAYRFIRRV